jgi:pyridoxine kinase
MAKILAISSYVASGHVGLGAIVPALQALGHDIIAVPTVLLSSHPGHPGFAGAPVDTALFCSILDALRESGRLDGVDAVMTGYMASPEHVQVTQQALTPLVADGYVGYLCDPIIGDWPKGLYVSEAVACAVRDLLVPMANITTPNAFELAWLSGQAVESADGVTAAAAALGLPNIVATSVPHGAGQIANVLVGLDEAGAWEAPLREGVPHGTGDLFAALLLGHLLHDRMRLPEAIARATSGVRIVIDDSVGCAELRLVANLAHAIGAAPTAKISAG